jgi:tetratricopeptide (TPR) repeat protein
MKALQKKPSARYQSADEMLHDLGSVREHLRDDSLHTRRIASANQGAASSALLSLAETLRRPRISIFTIVLVASIGALLLWGAFKFTQPVLPTPGPDAQKWYDKGLEALHGGAYYQASLAFQRAVEAAPTFVMAHARLAEAEMELGHADLAKNALLHVSELVPNRSALPRTEELYINAINGFVVNDLTRAINAYSELQQLDPTRSQVYVDLGRAYEKNDELSKAFESYREATRREPQFALALLHVGSLQGRHNDNTAGAISAFERALALYESLSLVEGQANVFYERGQLSIKLGRLNEAGAQLQRAVDLADASGNDSLKINAQLQLSRLAYIQAQPEKAQEYASRAIEFAQQHGLDDLLVLGMNGLGYVYFVSGKYEEAEKHYNKALEFARRNKSALREAEVKQSLATLYIHQLRTDEGLDYAQQALAFFNPNGYRTNAAICLTLIGRSYRRRGDYEAALRAFQQNLDMAVQSGYPPQIAFLQAEIAMVLMEQEHFPEALLRYNQSYDISKSLNDRLAMMYKAMNRGNLQWRLGLYGEARASLAEAYEIARQPGVNSSYQSVLAEVHLRKAEIALSERHFVEARSESEQAVALAGKQYEWVFVQAKLALGLAQAFSGAAAAGKAACEEAVEMAKRGGDYALLSKALLSLAEVRLEGGDAASALAVALEAKDSFARAGQQESEWRAWLVVARAHRRQRNEGAAADDLAHASDVLSQLRQKWGADAFSGYLTRPDIQLAHKQLGGSPALPAAGD